MIVLLLIALLIIFVYLDSINPNDDLSLLPGGSVYIMTLTMLLFLLGTEIRFSLIDNVILLFVIIAIAILRKIIKNKQIYKTLRGVNMVYITLFVANVIYSLVVFLTTTR